MTPDSMRTMQALLAQRESARIAAHAAMLVARIHANAELGAEEAVRQYFDSLNAPVPAPEPAKD